MLKRLAILAALPAVTQAPVPVPGQASNQTAGGSQKASNQQTDKNGNRNSAIPVIKKTREGDSGKDADQPRPENDNQPVTVSKFPPVSITKDWADWSYWGFGGLLFVVGALQAWFLWRTLRAIHTQGEHIKDQTKVLRESVAVAQTSANAALEQIRLMKSKERARIAITPIRPESLRHGYISLGEVEIEIANYGYSHALSVRGEGSALVVRVNELPVFGDRQKFSIPSVFQANGKPVKVEIDIPRDEVLFEEIFVERQTLFVYVAGIVEYEDLFGDGHQTDFKYRLAISTRNVRQDGGIDVSAWGGWKPESINAT